MTSTFDGSTFTITATDDGYDVTVTERVFTVTLVTADGGDLVKNATANARAMVRAGVDAWSADRIAYCFGLAARALAA